MSHSPQLPSPLQVVCAIIMNDTGDILACQRSADSDLAGKWEFPGGKIEPGETQKSALKREILEELAVEIEILDQLDTVTHDYPKLHIELHPYTCRVLSAQAPVALEHEDLLWIKPQKASSLDWADADVIVLNQLLEITESF